MEQAFDVAIIGGGINGCGCAADAALRGLSVVLLEQDDLASKTSSSSTKLVHGGLRYLENYEFSLVHKALNERQKLLDLAPHLVTPQPLFLPHQKHMRPSWLLRLGLFIYDHLSRKNRLPKCKHVIRMKKATDIVHQLQLDDYFPPLADHLDSGFVFYDAITDDARLSIANALQAKNHGASIRPRSAVISAQVINNLWQLTIKPKEGSCYTLYARTLINAAGPWVKAVEQVTQTFLQQKISLIKGSHIVVPAMYEGKHAYFLQHQDNRVIFVIPYHGYSMIGTTDIPLLNPSSDVSISNEEINYLVDLVNLYFKNKIHVTDIISTWSGVRALLSDDAREARSLTRDYSYELTSQPAPMVTIYGGKITTYRQLSEEVINQLSAVFPQLPASKTSISPLPGAIFKGMKFADYAIYARKKYSWLDSELLERYLHTYGSCMEQFLFHCTEKKSLGKKYGKYLYQAEVDYLIHAEWARSCEDILKRRTKLYLSMDERDIKELATYIQSITAESEPVLH